LRNHPACAAMARPAASLPVTVTAATRGSATTVSTVAGLDEEGLEGASGKARAAHQGLDGERALGDVGGVFEQAGVAGHQGWRKKAKDLPEGEVSRALRRARRRAGPSGRRWSVRAGVDRLGGEDACGVLGIVAADARAFGDLGAGFRDGLAHLYGDQRGEVGGLVFEQVGELAALQSARWARGTSA